MTVKRYLLSFPERFVRSALGLGAGVAREVGEVALPAGVRRSLLYQNLVDTTCRFLIEDVGGAEGVYRAEEQLPDNFLMRRTAGNAVEALGIVAFRASPVWVLAALADLSGMGRQLIPDIADALKTQGLLEQDRQFTSIDQMLDGLERTSSRLASTINTPRSASRDCERNGTPFAKKRATCSLPVCPPGKRSARCGRSSKQNPPGRIDRFSKHRR